MENYNDNEIIHLQPTINIGVIGSVNNGKSTLTGGITGTKTQRHSSELKQNITVKLGYANAKIYKCGVCVAPSCYQSFASSKMKATCKFCHKEMQLVRHVSFVDCPGHNDLLATMMNGTCVMDTTIVVEDLKSNVMPSSQTNEHVMATGVKKIPLAFICLNKVDVVPKNTTVKKIAELEAYLAKTNIVDCPIVPISACSGLNLDVVCEYLCTKIAQPKRDLTSQATMIVIRSFNVNRPNSTFADLCGGVVGGSVVKGVFKVGDKVQILPGLVIKKNDIFKYKPISSVIESINSEKNVLTSAIPGGLIGVRLDIDPALTVNDIMVGQVVLQGDDTRDYIVLEEMTIKVNPVNDNYKNLKKNDVITINYNGTNIDASIKDIKNMSLKLKLNKIICLGKNDLITVSKATKNVVDENSCGIIIGSAKVLNGKTVDVYDGNI